MKALLLSLLTATILASAPAEAQLRKVPSAVTDSFTQQFPQAQEVVYKDVLTSYVVRFVRDGAHYTAKYSSKGDWLETDRETSFDSLSSEVRDGFSKSKYAGWKVASAAEVVQPGQPNQYRVHVEKSDVQKRYLYFDQKGRMQRDSFTL